MTEPELKDQIINRIVEFKRLRASFKKEKELEPQIKVKTVIRILEEFLEE